MPPDTLVAIFAKYPQPSWVKTRMTQGHIPGWGALSEVQSAELYRAFLLDYVHNFSQAQLPYDAVFCLRPGPHLERFELEIAQGRMNVVLEPSWNGKSASSIGEAMGFTIRHFLQNGYAKCIILGSDLPHLDPSLIEEAITLLDQHVLVLGNDGGGCYLVSASDDPTSLVDPSITWSVGTDFKKLCKLEEAAGRSVGVLSQEVEDLDTAEDLARFLQTINHDTQLQQRVPHTLQTLKSWGLWKGELND